MCKSIEVTGDDDSKGIDGTYFISNITADKAPHKPTYKHEKMNRFIYYYPDEYGWRIGEYESLLPGTMEGWFSVKMVSSGLYHFLRECLLKIDNHHSSKMGLPCSNAAAVP